MKDIADYEAPKYAVPGSPYTPVEEGLYRIGAGDDTLYVTSLQFVQEPELGEGPDAGDISQFPLEDVLDRFYCHVSDFYPELNHAGTALCRLEFASSDLRDVHALRQIIGAHVHNRTTGDRVALVIE